MRRWLISRTTSRRMTCSSPRSNWPPPVRTFRRAACFSSWWTPGLARLAGGVAADTGDHRFVAPDNGVLTAVFQQTPPKRVVELTERRYARPSVSRTFEGRDRFAPAAAWLAKGVQLSALGRPVSDYRSIEIPVIQADADGIEGVVLRVDRFGNLVTNIDRLAFDRVASGGEIEIEVGGHSVGRLVETYADIAADEVCALFGSTDHLEIAANAASAVERLGVDRGAPVRLMRL